jgi:PAS domain S-box-containing protein
MCVLYIDDSEFAEQTATFLRERGFDVLVATSASEAWDRLDEHAVDCIVSEYTLEEATGVEFLESVRDIYPALPFILFTDSGSEAVASDAIFAGVTDYLQKGTGSDRYGVLADRIEHAIETTRETRDKRRQLDRRTQAIAAAPVGVTISDYKQDDNPLVYSNKAFTEVTGYSEAETVGRNCRFLQGENTDPERVAEMREAIDNGESVTVELRNYRKDGTEFWNRVSIAPLHDASGDVTEFVGFQEDVTARKEREQELREERAFIEQSLDALDDVFYVFGPDAEILRWNDRLGEVTGYTDEEIAGMTPTDFFPEDHRDRIAEAVEEVIETGSSTAQADYLTADGERIPHEFTGIRLTGPDGDLLGFAGIGRDITERLEHEQRLKARTERLEEFASIVSHDLRNPLNVAEGRLDLAREECDNEHLDAVAGAHDRMGQLIEELLTLAKDGEIAVDTQTISLATAVETCLETVQTDEATVRVESDCTFPADESRLRQLLANLVRNAIDHGDGDVTVRIGALENGFYVADDGPGIPESERDQVFESGFTTAGDGIGKGLSIVQRVVDAHGWTVEATESESGGARFEIQF